MTLADLWRLYANLAGVILLIQGTFITVVLVSLWRYERRVHGR